MAVNNLQQTRVSAKSKSPLPEDRRKVVAEIRRLAAAGEPLNICAVKRKHPELMEAVYRARPFWGWKQALTDSGIGYGDIRFEFQETVTCRICGFSGRDLIGHLRHKHRLAPQAYRKSFPGADVRSEWMRTRGKPKAKSPPLEHWEPIHTREYILDRLAEYHRRGYPVNRKWMYDNDNVLQQHVMRRGWNYNDLLREIGLDPAEVSTVRKTWVPFEREETLERLRAWIDGCGNRRPTGTLLERKHPDLFKAVVVHFGRFGAAMKAAGWHRRHGLKGRTRDELVEAIRRLTALRGTAHRAEWEAVEKRFRRVPKLPGVMRRIAADYGMDPGKIGKAGSFETAADVLEVLYARRAARKSVAAIKLKVLDRALYDAVHEHLGGFEQSYRELGWKYGRRRYPTRKSFLDAVRRRAAEGRPLSSKAIAEKGSGETGLLYAAQQYYGSWAKGLRAAGIEPPSQPRPASSSGRSGVKIKRCLT